MLLRIVVLGTALISATLTYAASNEQMVFNPHVATEVNDIQPESSPLIVTLKNGREIVAFLDRKSFYLVELEELQLINQYNPQYESDYPLVSSPPFYVLTKSGREFIGFGGYDNQLHLFDLKNIDAKLTPIKIPIGGIMRSRPLHVNTKKNGDDKLVFTTDYIRYASDSFHYSTVIVDLDKLDSSPIVIPSSDIFGINADQYRQATLSAPFLMPTQDDRDLIIVGYGNTKNRDDRPLYLLDLNNPTGSPATISTNNTIWGMPYFYTTRDNRHWMIYSDNAPDYATPAPVYRFNFDAENSVPELINNKERFSRYASGYKYIPTKNAELLVITYDDLRTVGFFDLNDLKKKPFSISFPVFVYSDVVYIKTQYGDEFAAVKDLEDLRIYDLNDLKKDPVKVSLRNARGTSQVTFRPANDSHGDQIIVSASRAFYIIDLYSPAKAAAK